MVRSPYLLCALACLAVLVAAPAAHAGGVTLAIEPATEVTPTSFTVWGTVATDPGAVLDMFEMTARPAAGGPPVVVRPPGPSVGNGARLPVTFTGLAPGTTYVVEMSAGGAAATASVTTAQTGGRPPRNTSPPTARWPSDNLSCDLGQWAGDGVVTEPVVRWLRDGKVVAVQQAGDGDVPFGEHRLSDADRGRTFSCQVTAASVYGTTTVESGPLRILEGVVDVYPGPPWGETWPPHPTWDFPQVGSTSPGTPPVSVPDAPAGSPPAPQAESPPDPVRSAIVIAGGASAHLTLRASLHAGLAMGRTLRCRMPAGRLVVTWRSGGQVIARGVHVQRRAGSAAVAIGLTRAGRRALREHALWVTARAEFRAAGGRRTVATRRVLVASLRGALR